MSQHKNAIIIQFSGTLYRIPQSTNKMYAPCPMDSS